MSKKGTLAVHTALTGAQGAYIDSQGYYGSDEEQARTVVRDAVEQKCHTHRCCSKMNEKER